MKKIVFCFYSIWVGLTVLSCKHHSTQTDMIFQKVENLAEQFPDSALMLLDSIHNPYELTESQYLRYILLSVHTKDLAYQDIETDTVIFRARDYFKQKHDHKNFILAEYNCGRVLQSQGKTEEAMQYYLQAKHEANEKDLAIAPFIDFFMGELNYNQRMYYEAIPHYQNAAIGFSAFDERYRSLISSYQNTGNCFLLEGNSDSAFYYYDKALDIAVLHNDSGKQADVLQNMGVAYFELEDYQKAKARLNQTLSLMPEENRKVKLYINLANVYHQENKNDSALYYSNLALSLSEDDTFLKVTVYGLLSRIEETAENYKTSLDYSRQYAELLETVFEETEQGTLLEIQKKYNFELLQNANKTLVIQRLWISILLIVVMVVAGFVLLYYRSQNKEALLIAKQQIYQLKEMVEQKAINKNEMLEIPSDMQENNHQLRTILFNHLDIFKKISLLEAYLKEEEKEKGKYILNKVFEIIYDPNQKFDWNIFYQPVNALHNDFLTRLQNRFPALNEEEILVCCLTKIGFSNIEIALLIKSTANRIQKMKSLVREKTDMKVHKSFVKNLDEIINQE